MLLALLAAVVRVGMMVLSPVTIAVVRIVVMMLLTRPLQELLLALLSASLGDVLLLGSSALQLNPVPLVLLPWCQAGL